jgi:hypothetical protein
VSKKTRRQQPIPQKQTGPQAAPPLGQAGPALAPPHVQRMFLGYDPAAQQEPVDIESSKTGWSEFELKDGTTVRIKGVLIDVKRVVGQYAPDGKPLYICQMTMVPDFVVPAALMKPK